MVFSLVEKVLLIEERKYCIFIDDGRKRVWYRWGKYYLDKSMMKRDFNGDKIIWFGWYMYWIFWLLNIGLGKGNGVIVVDIMIKFFNFIVRNIL